MHPSPTIQRGAEAVQFRRPPRQQTHIAPVVQGGNHAGVAHQPVARSPTGLRDDLIDDERRHLRVQIRSVHHSIHRNLGNTSHGPLVVAARPQVHHSSAKCCAAHVTRTPARWRTLLPVVPSYLTANSRGHLLHLPCLSLHGRLRLFPAPATHALWCVCVSTCDVSQRTDRPQSAN
ncbi:MAG: hypothetical protein SGPRY_002729 [Prymnesium sp.]